jgi:hypothetical protein
MAYLYCMRTMQAMHMPPSSTGGAKVVTHGERRDPHVLLGTRSTLPGSSAAHDSSRASLPTIWPGDQERDKGESGPCLLRVFGGFLGPERVEDASQEVAFERW